MKETISQPISDLPPVVENKKSKKKILIAGLVILFVLVFGAIGFLVYQNYQLKQQISRIPSPPDLPIKPTPTPDPTADWKIYANEKYGFELKYPWHWGISESGFYDDEGKESVRPFIVWGDPPELEGLAVYAMYLFIENNPKKLSSKEYVNELIEKEEISTDLGLGKLDYQEVRYEIINKINITELYNVFAYDQHEERIYIAQDDKVYQFSFPVASENANILNPIENNKLSHLVLSTFKFLDE